MNKLPDEHPPIPSRSPRVRRTPGPKASYAKYGWILLGVAAAAGAVGAGFGIAESELHEQAVAADPAMTTRGDVNSKRDTGATYGAIAYTGIGIGGAALLAAAIVFIVDPSRGETHVKQQYLDDRAVGGPDGRRHSRHGALLMRRFIIGFLLLAAAVGTSVLAGCPARMTTIRAPRARATATAIKARFATAPSACPTRTCPSSATSRIRRSTSAMETSCRVPTT